MEKKMTSAELAAFRLNKGKTTEELLAEDRAKTIQQNIAKIPPAALEINKGPNPLEFLSEEDKKMRADTDAGYEFTKKQDLKKKGGMIKKMAAGGSASSRADGCAVRGKTKGMMR